MELLGMNPDCSFLWYLNRWSLIRLRRTWPGVLSSVMPRKLIQSHGLHFPFQQVRGNPTGLPDGSSYSMQTRPRRLTTNLYIYGRDIANAQEPEIPSLWDLVKVEAILTVGITSRAIRNRIEVSENNANVSSITTVCHRYEFGVGHLFRIELKTSVRAHAVT